MSEITKNDIINGKATQEELAETAKKSEDRNLRKLAVDYLTDHELLADVVINGDSIIRYIALEKLTDPAELAEVAKNAGNSSDYEDEFEYYGDESANFHGEDGEYIIITGDDGSKARLKALEKLKYLDISENTLQKELIKKIINNTILGVIIENGHYSLRKAAIENDNLIDQSLLENIAKNDEIEFLRKTAIKKITNQEILADIANYGKYIGTCRSAVYKITDQALLINIAKNNTHSDLRINAAVKLIDHKLAQEVYADIAKNKNSGIERKEAIERLTDQSVLTDIAKNDKYSYYRIEAARKLYNQNLSQVIYTDIRIFHMNA